MIQMIFNWFNRRFSDPQVVILWLILLGGFLAIFFFGEMLQPVFAALIIAYLLEGIVHPMTNLRVPRNIAVYITFLLFMICLAGLVVGLLPLLSRQIGQLIKDLPDLIANGQKQLMQLPHRHPEFISEAQLQQLINFLKSELTRLGQNALMFSVASLKNIITILVYLVLVPLLVLFFMKDKNLILSWFRSFLPPNMDLATEVWTEVNTQVANYVRGKIWEIIIVWVADYVAFLILGLNFALLISFFIGISVLVPYIGATIITIPVVLMAFFQWGFDTHFLYTISVYAIIMLIDGNVLVPLLLSEVVNLHPVAIVVAILVFGGLWGFWGLFLAIPLATLVHAVIRAWFSKTRPLKADEHATEPEG